MQHGQGCHSQRVWRPSLSSDVVIEVVRALVRQAGERAVVQRALQHVGIDAVAVEVEHALRPEDQRHRGAGLGIRGVVRQVVVLGEAFVGGARGRGRR